MVEITGSTSFEFNGQTFRLLFSNRALADAEKMLGKSIPSIFKTIENVGFNDIAVMFFVGMDAAKRYYRLPGKRYSMNDTFQLMDEIGFIAITPIIAKAVGDVIQYKSELLSGDSEDEDESPNE